MGRGGKSNRKDKGDEVTYRVPAHTSAWRLFSVEVTLDRDPGKDDTGPHSALYKAISRTIGLPLTKLEGMGVDVVKKSFDGRWKKAGQPKFIYTVDVDFSTLTGGKVKVYPKLGQIEALPLVDAETPVETVMASYTDRLTHDAHLDVTEHLGVTDAHTGVTGAGADVGMDAVDAGAGADKIVIVGAGPAGLFAALAMVQAGLKPIIVERGQPVERRGRSIGALFNRKILDPESNLCYGEGGAGTWSDGKLTTRIGKNSANVRWVLEELVKYGAPDRILVDGKPHLGTDRLVRILKSVREHLEERGVVFMFDTCVSGLRLGPVAGGVG
ncbi:hypothetical protein B484DRAFT_421242, partial [Ochromonadaceae sp. CCMP2298]